ncbi:alpha/beta-hydrolase [Mollisia scopiformis]|uniref:Alpha/beta-hydrolase n=1 Tax=Mollisia scopiformis TaxID=149040 RepID=A0A194WZA9_MOLSC|nr:alpha/beta-hydrolase [Mollisia scopiformis]KUJ12932.1 alpha/beta-hydrolase [Mollisia scopiformis]
MPLTSDLTLNAAKFDPASNSKQTSALNEALIAKLEQGPKWFEVGAAKYREMRWAGETALPAPTMLPEAIDITILSRENGRDIPCRLFFPSGRKSEADQKKCKGVVMHIHGGGWVLGDQKSNDDLLQFYAEVGDLAVVSVGYRKAPEDPFPKGPQDCFDAGDYLVKNSESQYGGPLRFIGGESAGAHLSLLATFHLLKLHADLKLSGLLLHYGCYDLSWLPSAKLFNKSLILDQEIMHHFTAAFLPGMSFEQKQDPSVSPLYENLENFRGRLPSALFTIGTEDPLLEDSVFMSTRWLMAGGHAILKVYSGAPHGFNRFPKQALKEAGDAADDTEAYIKERLEQV